MPSPSQPSEVSVPSVTREILSTQGLLKGVGTKLKRMQKPKKKKIAGAAGNSVGKMVGSMVGSAAGKAVGKMAGAASKRMMDIPRTFDINKVQAQDIKAQGGKTPSSVTKQIKEKRAYDVKYGPGLYKSKKK